MCFRKRRILESDLSNKEFKGAEPITGYVNNGLHNARGVVCATRMP